MATITTSHVPSELRRLREALAPYLDVTRLRDLIAQGGDFRQALLIPEPPAEVAALLQLLVALLRPEPGVSVRSMRDLAALLMVELAPLHHEELRVVCLNHKFVVQQIHTAFLGHVEFATVQISDVFREPIRLNSTMIALAHNHPSNDVLPSTEDVMLTRKLVAAGKQLGIEILDHLIIGRGSWMSIRARGLGFENA